jgi:ribosome-binding protein aMBF1 (putative translation factor)
MQTIPMMFNGKKYMAIPLAEYKRLAKVRNVDAQEATRNLIAESLKAAREAGGLTQAQLAAKLKKSQTMIAQSESGVMHVSETYVAKVLKACGLPKTWCVG